MPSRWLGTKGSLVQAPSGPVGTSRADAADDPAIWRNPADPAASLVVGTDKKGGLYVYDLKGAQKSFLAAPGLNNVDLIEIAGGRVLVIASDRSDLATVNLFMALLDTATGKLAPAGKIAVGPGEGYGICMVKPARGGEVIAFSAPIEAAVSSRLAACCSLRSARSSEAARISSDEVRTPLGEARAQRYVAAGARSQIRIARLDRKRPCLQPGKPVELLEPRQNVRGNVAGMAVGAVIGDGYFLHGVISLMVFWELSVRAVIVKPGRWPARTGTGRSQKRCGWPGCAGSS